MFLTYSSFRARFLQCFELEAVLENKRDFIARADWNDRVVLFGAFDVVIGECFGGRTDTTAEPCPMCLGATLWANIPVVYYGCTREDSDEIGFRDEVFYEYLAGENDLLTVSEFERERCLELFEAYTEIEGKTEY